MSDPTTQDLLEPLTAPEPSTADLLEPLRPNVAPEAGDVPAPKERKQAFRDIEAAADTYAIRLRQQQDQDADLERQLTAYRAANATTAPEKQVDVLRYSAATGLPPGVVEQHLDELKTQVDSKALAAALASRPEYAQFIADAAKAPLAKDDAAALGWLEWGLTGKWENVPQRLVGPMTIVPGALETPDISFGLPELKVGPAWARAFRDAIAEQKIAYLSAKQAHGVSDADEEKELDDLEEKYGEKDYGANNPLSNAFIKTFKLAPMLAGGALSRIAGAAGGRLIGTGIGAAAGAETGPGELATIPAGAAFGAEAGEYAGGFAFDYYQNVGPQFRQLRKLKDADGNPLLSDDEARIYAQSASGMAASITAVLGAPAMKSLPGAKQLLAKVSGQALTKALFDNPALSTSLRNFAVRYGTHLASGGAMMAVQAGANAGAVQLATVNHGGEFDAAAVPEAMAHAFSQGVKDMLLVGALEPGREFLRERGVAAEVQESQRQYSVLWQAAKASKLLDRDPETFQVFLQRAAAAGGPDAATHVHIPVEDWNSYWQGQKVDPARAAADLLGDEGKAYGEASSTHGEISIPTGDYFGKLGKTDHVKGLELDVKFNSEARTPREQRAFEKAEAAKLEKLARERATELHEGGQEVHDFIRDQALGADVPAREADAVAKQVSEYAKTMALRLNVSVREAATLGGLSKLRILGPKGDTVANAAQRRFRERTAPTASVHLAERLKSMELPARVHEMYRDENTGLLNARAFGHLSSDKAFVGHISIEGVKYINDHKKGGHEFTDQWYRTAGKALHAADPLAAKVGGDFAVRVNSEKELEQTLEVARANLPEHLRDVLAITGRVGKDLKEAGLAHRAFLDKELAEGQRANPRPPDPANPKGKPLPPERPHGMVKAGVDAPDLVFPPDRAEAVVPDELVTRAGGLSDKAYFEEVYRDPSGILTLDGWNNIPRKKFVASIDLKGLKGIVKRWGDDVTDRYVHQFGQIISHFGGSSFDFARLHGDEFAAQHDDEGQLRAWLEKLGPEVHNRVGVRLTLPDGTSHLVDRGAFRSDTGRSYKEADDRLNAAKEREGEQAGAQRPGDGDRRGVGQVGGGESRGGQEGEGLDRGGGRNDVGAGDVPGGAGQAHEAGAGEARPGDLAGERPEATRALRRGATPQHYPGSRPVTHLDGVPVVFRGPDDRGPEGSGGGSAPPGDQGPRGRGGEGGGGSAGDDGRGVAPADGGRDAAGRSELVGAASGELREHGPGNDRSGAADPALLDDDRSGDPAQAPGEVVDTSFDVASFEDPHQFDAELGPDAHAGERREARPDPETVKEVREWISRMKKPDRKEAAEAFLAYAIGERAERPEITPKLEKELAAKFIVDPYGYRFDSAGRDMSQPLGGPRGPGISKDASQHERMRASERSREMRDLKREGQSVGSRHKGKRNKIKFEQKYFAHGKEGPRGTIEFKLEDGAPVHFDIQMLERDRSTLAHETAHFLSWSLHEIATSDLATEGVRTDYAKLLEWAGYSSPEERIQLTQEHALLAAHEGELSKDGAARLKALSAKEERISHGWEQYLAEGKSPSRELASTFGRFKAWMLRIYRGLPGIEEQYRTHYGEELKLSDDVRRVFDRLLAADDALKSAKQESGGAGEAIRELLGTMTPKEQQEYLKALADGKLGADEETNRRAAEIFKEEVPEQRAAIEADVTKELDREPVNRAQRFLQKGDLVDEEGNLLALPAELLHHETKEPLKLNKDAFVRQYGPEAAADMPARIFSAKKKEGVSPDAVAPFLGFETGKQLVDALRKAEPREQAIARETQSRVDEIYAPALKLIGDAAMAAVHSDAAARAALLELRAMAKSVDPSVADRVRVTDLNTLRRTAEATINESRVGDVDPEKYLRLERQAALKRERLWGEGDREKAMEAAEARLLNQLLYRAARDAADRLDKAKAKLSKTSDETRSYLGKADVAYRDIHDQILEAVGLARKATDGERVALDVLLTRAEQDAQLLDFDVSVVRRLLEDPKPWDSLQVAEAKAITDAITNIRHVARLKNELVLAGKAQEKDDWFREMVEHLMRRPAQEKVKFSKTAEGLKEGMLHLGRGGDAILTDVETLAAMLDAHDRDGPNHRLLVDGRLEAREKSLELDKRVLEPIRKAWDAVPKELRKLGGEPVDVANLLPVPPGTEDRIAPVYTRDTLWMLYLNWGNAGNRQRIRDGNGWSDGNVEKALGLLSEHEIDFLQAVLDTINGLYPDVARVHEGRTGLELDQVPATPITINGKTRAGGYFPLKYDARLAKQGEMQEGDVVKAIAAPSYVKPATARSHTKERADEVHAPVNLTWGVVPSHLAQVIHDIAYGDWVRQAAGVVLDDRFKALATQYIGSERQKEVVPWLRDVANARADSAASMNSDFTRELGQFARNRLASAAIAYNIPVIAQGIVDAWGAFQEDVPLHQIASAYVKVGSPQNWGKFPEFKLSKEMAYRDATYKDNLRKTLTGMGPEKVKLNHVVTETGFALYELMDKFSTRVTFKAAFDDALSKGMDEKAAARRADDVVRRMFASHDLAEKAPILRSKQGLAGLVMFYGFSNRYYNALRRRVDRVYVTMRSEEAGAGAKTKAVFDLAAKMMAMGIIGSVGSYIAGRGPETDPDPKKADNPLAWLAWRTMLEPLNTVPFLGSFAEKIIRGQKVNPRSAPELALVEDTVDRIGNAVAKFRKNGAGDPDVILAEVLALTAALGGPVGLVNRTGGYVKQLATGQAKPRGSMDVAGGMLYGDRPKQPHTPPGDAQTLSDWLFK